MSDQDEVITRVDFLGKSHLDTRLSTSTTPEEKRSRYGSDVNVPTTPPGRRVIEPSPAPPPPPPPPPPAPAGE